MGKTWLMQYLEQIAPIHEDLGPHVRVGRLYALNPQYQTREGFVTRVLAELQVLHEPVLPENALNRLISAAEELRRRLIIPVLCVDEFAALIGKPGFDKDFVDCLRTCTEEQGLVLITSSIDPLYQVLRQMTGETGHLLNNMSEIKLNLFDEEEARGFVREKGQRDGLSSEEQEFFLDCAAERQADGRLGWPPMLLQLAGRTLISEKSMALLGQGVYKPSDPTYRADFQRRLIEAYRAVVRDS